MDSGKHTLDDSLREEKAAVTSEGAWIAGTSGEIFQIHPEKLPSESSSLHGGANDGTNKKGSCFRAGVVMTARANWERSSQVRRNRICQFWTWQTGSLFNYLPCLFFFIFYQGPTFVCVWQLSWTSNGFGKQGSAHIIGWSVRLSDWQYIYY